MNVVKNADCQRIEALGAALVLCASLAACSNGHEKEPVESIGRTQPALTVTEALSISLPLGANLNDVTLSTNESVQVADGVEVFDDAGIALIANAGEGETRVGRNARTEDIISVGSVFLHRGARVDGSVVSEGTITAQEDVVVTGTQTEHATLSPPLVLTRPIDFAGGPDIFRDSNLPPLELAPGSYGNVTIQPASALSLVAGTYHFESLALNRARLELTTSGEPIVIYVRTRLEFDGDFELTGDPGDVFFGIFGAGIMPLASLSGTVVAPQATLKFTQAGDGFAGSFFAHAIEAGSNLTSRNTPPGNSNRDPVTIEHVPFDHWGSQLVPIPTLRCTQLTHDGRVAIFGYENGTGVPLNVPLGDQNQFDPDPGVDPIVDFEPGTFVNAMVVPMPGDSLTWTLGATQITADSSSSLCGIDGEGASMPAADTIARLLPDVYSPGFQGVSEDEALQAAAASRTGPGVATQAAGTGVITQQVPVGGLAPFVFQFASISVPDGDSGAEQEPYVSELFINGVASSGSTQGDSMPVDLPDCEEDTTCSAFDRFVQDVPVDQGTVSVALTIKEDDDDPNNDDTELVLSLTFDNLTGALINGTAFSEDPEVTNPVAPGATCAGAGGWTVCWTTEPAARPRICTSWKAQYADGGPAPGGGEDQSEDYLASRDQHELPASFAGYLLRVTDDDGIRFSSHTFLDADGCVPFELSPPTSALVTGADGGPMTIHLELHSRACLDPTGNNCHCVDSNGVRCAKDTGAEFRVREPGLTTGAWHLLCSELSEDSMRVSPGCNVNDPDAGGTTIADWVNGFPPSQIDIQHPDNNHVTRVAALTGFLLRREVQLKEQGVTAGLGIEYGVADKSFAMSIDPTKNHDEADSLFQQMIRIDVNSVCASVDDTCAGDPISLRGDTLLQSTSTTCTRGEPDCVPSDSFYKFVVVHEIGHVVQRRSLGNIAGALDEVTSPTDLCDCAHIETSNTLHCLQSLEGSGAAQREAFGQLFAAAAFNDPGPDCRFNYYKEFASTECVAGREPIGGCVERNGRQVTLPPVPVSCSEPVKWRNNQCANTLVDFDHGIEFDWMGFYRNLLYGAAPTINFQELAEVYQVACGAQGTPCDLLTNPTVVFQNPDAGEAALVNAVSQKFGAGSTQETNVSALGDSYGVSQNTAP